MVGFIEYDPGSPNLDSKTRILFFQWQIQAGAQQARAPP